MTDKLQNKYRISSARYPNWDYRWSGAYFITICTHYRKPYFGNIINGKMQLSGIGILADVFLYKIQNHTKNVELGEFVVMPNHVHLVLILNGENGDNFPGGFGDIGGNGRNGGNGGNGVNGGNGRIVFTIM